MYVVTDASGESRRKRTIWRCAEWFRLALCLSPGWLSLGEWQRDWAREKTLPDLANLLLEHGGATGVAYAWELQLLAENKQPGF